MRTRTAAFSGAAPAGSEPASPGWPTRGADDSAPPTSSSGGGRAARSWSRARGAPSGASNASATIAKPRPPTTNSTPMGPGRAGRRERREAPEATGQVEAGVVERRDRMEHAPPGRASGSPPPPRPGTPGRAARAAEHLGHQGEERHAATMRDDAAQRRWPRPSPGPGPGPAARTPPTSRNSSSVEPVMIRSRRTG